MYKVRASKREDGGYDLSYGKGKKKICGVTKKDPSNNKWFVDIVGHFKKLSDLKVAWGKWAEKTYHGDSKAYGETVDKPVPAPLPPPPSIPASEDITEGRKRGRPRGNGLVPTPPEGEVGRAEYAANPDDPRFRYPDDYEDESKRGKATPLGVLLSIQEWHERYKDRVSEINHRIALLRIPGFNPFSFLRMIVDETIELEIKKGEDNESIRTTTSETEGTTVSGNQRPIPPCP